MAALCHTTEAGSPEREAGVEKIWTAMTGKQLKKQQTK
jgi:hypothetical protein